MKKTPVETTGPVDYPSAAESAILRRRFMTILGGGAAAALFAGCGGKEECDTPVNDAVRGKIRMPDPPVVPPEGHPDVSDTGELHHLSLPEEAPTHLKLTDGMYLGYRLRIQTTSSSAVEVALANQGEILETTTRLLGKLGSETLETPEGLAAFSEKMKSFIEKIVEKRSGIRAPLVATRLEVTRLSSMDYRAKGGVGMKAIPPTTGTAWFSSEPWAKVSVDGIFFMATPTVGLELSAGEHYAVMESPINGKRAQRTFEVVPGERTQISESFTPFDAGPPADPTGAAAGIPLVIKGAGKLSDETDIGFTITLGCASAGRADSPAQEEKRILKAFLRYLRTKCDYHMASSKAGKARIRNALEGMAANEGGEPICDLIDFTFTRISPAARKMGIKPRPLDFGPEL